MNRKSTSDHSLLDHDTHSAYGLFQVPSDCGFLVACCRAGSSTCVGVPEGLSTEKSTGTGTKHCPDTRQHSICSKNDPGGDGARPHVEEAVRSRHDSWKLMEVRRFEGCDISSLRLRGRTLRQVGLTTVFDHWDWQWISTYRPTRESYVGNLIFLQRLLQAQAAPPEHCLDSGVDAVGREACAIKERVDR